MPPCLGSRHTGCSRTRWITTVSGKWPSVTNGTHHGLQCIDRFAGDPLASSYIGAAFRLQEHASSTMSTQQPVYCQSSRLTGRFPSRVAASLHVAANLNTDANNNANNDVDRLPRSRFFAT